MKSPKKLLEMLLTNWDWCVSQPKICKSVWLPKRITGDEFLRALIRSLVLHGGDWRAAADCLDASQDRKRVDGFRAFAAALTSPLNRGLLLAAPTGYQDETGFHFGTKGGEM